MDVGHVSAKTFLRTDCCWKIPDFFSRTEDETVDRIHSPRFLLSTFSCRLALNTHGLRQGSKLQFLVLMIDEPLHVQKVCFTVGVEKSGGTVEGAETLIFKARTPHICLQLKNFNLSVLQERRSELVPSGTLTIACSVETYDDRSRPKMVSSQSSQTSEVDASSPDDVSTPSSEVAGDLEQALTGLSLSRKDRNITISTGGKTFKTCMSILCVRAPAFASEIHERLKDAETSTVDVGDLCSLSAFKPFLEFVNTGDVQHLTKEAAFELYVTADRFKMEELKEFCAKRTKASEPKFMIFNA